MLTLLEPRNYITNDYIILHIIIPDKIKNSYILNRYNTRYYI
jgi:hypothetical protein